MKKVINVLGIFGSVILSIILTILIFIYVLFFNAKLIVSENALSRTLKKIDVPETLKNVDNGMVWDDFSQLAGELNLTEKEFEQILNSDKVKEEVGSYLSKVISSVTNEKEVNITEEQMENFFNIVVDEYNKVSGTKISDSERKEIVNFFDEEMINNINESVGSINLKETVDSDYIGYIELVDKVLFGNYTTIILLIIIGIIGLIALFRFSYYKWMAYVKICTIVPAILMLIIGVLLLILPLQTMEIYELILPIKNTIIANVFITAIVLLIISVVLSIGHKKLHNKTKEILVEQS